MKPIPDELLQTAVFILVGLMGGAVRYLRYFQRQAVKFSLVHMLADVLTGGFLGMLTVFLGIWLGMEPAATGFMAGVAGLMGGEAIKLFIDRFKKVLS